MKRQLFGTAGSLAALLFVMGCVDDPTAALRGDLDRIMIERTYLELDVGESATIAAQAFDEQGNALSVLLDIASSDASVFTVEIDTLVTLDPLPETNFTVTAVGPGSAQLTASAQGVSSAASTVVSFPTAFTGTVAAAASGMGWDIVTLSAPTGVAFDTENTTATIDGVEAFIHSITASELQLVNSTPDAVTGGTIEISDLVFLGAYPISSLEATTTVDLAAFQNFMTTSIATAPNIGDNALPMTFYGIVTSADPDVIAKVAPTNTVNLATSVYWADHDTDIDVFYTDAGDNFVNCLGCGGSNPEVGTFSVTGGGTNYFYVELWSGDPTVFQVTIVEDTP